MSHRRKPLVLIIDDAAFAASLAETFERDGLRASTAFFAWEGCSKAVQQRPDMIILDINLQRCRVRLPLGPLGSLMTT